MATVVNDRDLQLEATSPRVAGVTLPSNVTVPGLAGAIASTKNVSLAATSQIFQIPKSGSISPSSITVTATVNNLVNTPTLTIQSGTMSVTPALSGGAYTFTASQMTSDTVTLLLSLTEASITYTDTMTFVKVREGIDSINVVLSNENVTLPSDSSGNVLSYSTATGNIKVFQGTNDVTSVCTFAIASGGNPAGLTYTLPAGPGGSGGSYAVTGGFSAGLGLTSLTIAVTFGTTVINQVFTLSKAYAGTPGTSGSPGLRGSVNLSVALSGSTATWSDSLANSTVLSYAGAPSPIRLDQVTEYNNSVGFSQTKFYDGSAWQLVSVYIDGNLLVSGTVAANALSANSVTSDKIVSQAITTDKLLVTGRGKALNADPTMTDIKAWNILSGTAAVQLNSTQASPGGPNVFALTGTGSGEHINSYLFPVQGGKTYKVSVWVKSTSTAGALYIRMPSSSADGSSSTGIYVQNLAGGQMEALAMPTTWTQYVGYNTPTSGASVATIELYANWSTGTNTTYVSDFRVEEYIDADLIVNGAITANKISVTNLSAITANLGSVTIATGGFLSSGQTAFNTGTGFWLGSVSSVPKFSIGSSSGASLVWDGTNLTITNANVSQPTLTLPSYSASIAAGDISNSFSTTGGPFTIGTRTVTVSGGTSPYKYTWAISNVAYPAGSVVLSNSGGNSATYTLAGKATVNSEVTGSITCTVTDSQGRVTTASVNFDATFGPI